MKNFFYVIFVCLFFSSCYVQNNNTAPKPKKRIIIEYRWSNGAYWNTYPSPYHNHHYNHHKNRPSGQNNGPRR